jgi:hypothetical protein
VQAQQENPAAQQPASMPNAQGRPRLQAKRIITVSGKENWDELTGFGKESGMVEMMTLMMVGGSGMEHMKMGAMKPGSMPKGTAGQAMKPSGLPFTVKLLPNPPIVGDNTLDVLVTDSKGKPISGLKLSVAVAMTSMDMGTDRPKVVEGNAGHYAVTVHFSMQGPWRVTLHSDASGSTKQNLDAALDFNVDAKTRWTLPAAGY